MSKHNYLWKLAIVLLIAVFSIAGVISCSESPTQSASLSSDTTTTDTSAPDTTTPDTSTPTTPDTSAPTTPTTPTTPTYGEDTYYTVQVPFAKSGYNDTEKVSYKDTNRLNQLWKAMLRREGVNDGQIYFIRNSGGPYAGNQNTSQYLFAGDNYFYIDDNMNIGYRGTIIKKYYGAVLIPYADKQGGYTVGGVYSTAFNGYDGDWGHFGSKRSQGQATIMGRTDNRKAGDKDVILINREKRGRQFNGLGVDQYWKSTRTASANYSRDSSAAAWSQNINNFLARDPDELLKDLDARHHYNWTGGNDWMEILWEAQTKQYGYRGPQG